MSSSDAYTRIHGLDFSSAIKLDGTKPSGGGRKSTDYTLPDWGRSEVQDAGREPKKYTGDFRSLTKQDIMDIIAEFNAAPKDAEFYPMDSDLCVYAALASAGVERPELYVDSAKYKNYYYGSFEVISREPAAFGVRQGLLYAENVSLPAVSETLTNEGADINTLDYVALSGAYDEILGYTDDIKILIGSQEIALCEQLMRNDLFEVSRWGEVRHSYTLDWTRCFESLQIDLGGPEFCYGGIITLPAPPAAIPPVIPIPPYPVGEPSELDFSNADNSGMITVIS